MSGYVKSVVAKNVRIRGNLATLSKHLVAGGMLECAPFGKDDKECTDSRDLNNAFVEAIHLVNSNVSLPYDVELNVWDKQFILQTGEMQRAATTLIPVLNTVKTHTINLVDLQDNSVDWYGIIKHFDWPSVDTTTISNTDTLNFNAEHVKEHTTQHRHDPRISILSSACKHMNILYKATALLVQQKRFKVSVLLNRTPGFWYILQDVLSASIEFLLDLQATNKKLDIGEKVCVRVVCES